MRSQCRRQFVLCWRGTATCLVPLLSALDKLVGNQPQVQADLLVPGPPTNQALKILGKRRQRTLIASVRRVIRRPVLCTSLLYIMYKSLVHNTGSLFWDFWGFSRFLHLRCGIRIRGHSASGTNTNTDRVSKDECANTSMYLMDLARRMVTCTTQPPAHLLLFYPYVGKCLLCRGR